MKPNRCKRPLPEGMVCGLDPDHDGPCGAPWKMWERWNWVPSQHYYKLNQACVMVNDALGHFGCYHVGSSLERRDYRDVDVRFIMDDAEYDRLFSRNGGYLDPLWSLMCTTISDYLSQQSGLPVDFQIQRQTQANAEHDGPRNPLGVFHDYPGERPSEIKTEQL